MKASGLTVGGFYKHFRSLEAGRKNVAVRAELERILEDQVKMSTATEATLRDAQAQAAEAAVIPMLNP